MDLPINFIGNKSLRRSFPNYKGDVRDFINDPILCNNPYKFSQDRLAEYLDIFAEEGQKVIDFMQSYNLKNNRENYNLISEEFDTILERDSMINGKEVALSMTKDELNELANSDSLGDALDSLHIQKELNPHFWPNNNLNSRVRLKLLDIADAFCEFLEVDWAKPKDILFVGSLASYNWSKYSDIDLHIVYDFKDIDEKVDFVKEYVDSKKKIWNDQHDKLRIYGFPIEVYVQDINDNNVSAGEYSVEEGKWIKEPDLDDIKSIKLNKKIVVEKALVIIDKIDEFEKRANEETDEYKLEELGREIKRLFIKIKGARRESIKNNGEFSIDNIVFKILRRMGYIAKLVELKTNIYDKINTIK